MKKMLCLTALVLVLTGCSAGQVELEEALAFRSGVLGAGSVSFDARITADYTDRVERFGLHCRADSAGAVTFTVTDPEAISGITGSVAGIQGTLTFDDTVLAFPLLAQERLSPVSGPWVMIQALRSGYITACVREGDLLHLTVNDSYEEDALTLEIWIRGREVTAAEIAWRGIRQMSLEITNFSME